MFPNWRPMIDITNNKGILLCGNLSPSKASVGRLKKANPEIHLHLTNVLMKRAIPFLILISMLIGACQSDSPSDTSALNNPTTAGRDSESDAESEQEAAEKEQIRAQMEATRVEAAQRSRAAAEAGETVWRIHPQWQWNGANIAYYERIGDSASLVVIDVDGKEISRFETGASYAANPSWSPLGDELVYSKAASGMSDEWNVWRVNADGTNSRLFVDAEDRAMHPSWDPTNAMIAFIKQDGDDTQLVVGNPRTSVTRQITSTPGQRYHPKWLDEFLFAIYDKTLDGESQICQANVFRREETCLFGVDGFDVSAPAASRNGAIIAFTMREKTEGATSDIWLYQVANESFFQLTDTPEESEGAPYFSPDGRWVVFHSDKDGQYNIHRMRIDQSKRMQLTN